MDDGVASGKGFPGWKVPGSPLQTDHPTSLSGSRRLSEVFLAGAGLTVYSFQASQEALQFTEDKVDAQTGKGLVCSHPLEAEPKPAPPHPPLPSLGAASWTRDALTSQSQRALWEILRAYLCTGDSLSLSLSSPIILERQLLGPRGPGKPGLGPVDEEWSQEKTSVISSFPFQPVMC